MQPVQKLIVQRRVLLLMVVLIAIGATLVIAQGGSKLVAENRDILSNDADGDGGASSGDTIRYEITIANCGPNDAENVQFSDAPDGNTQLVPGSVSIGNLEPAEARYCGGDQGDGGDDDDDDPNQGGNPNARARDDVLNVTNGGSSNLNIATNDRGNGLQVLSFGDSPATVGTFPADGVTVGSFPAGGGTIDVTIDAAGNMTATANGTTGTGTVTIFYEIQAANGSTDIAQVDITFGDFPTAVDDTLATLGAGNEYSTDVGVTLNVAAGTGLLNNDTLGNPAATLTDWGGGDASPAVNRNPGTSRPFAGGTLTVNADGSFDLVNPTIPGVYTFDYILDNGLGSSQATVEIYVNDPPVAQDDAFDANLSQTNNYAAPALFNDNGSGADYLGAPPATISGWGNIDGVSGNPTEFLPSSTQALPVGIGGTLTVNADGSFVVDSPTTTGSFTFEYQIDNGVGTDTATVTVSVVATPVTQDDAFFVIIPNNLAGDLTADNGSGADDPGTPAFTSLTFGGGSLGGTVTDNPGGSTVALAGGTLTLNNDGSFTLNGATNPDTYTFDYQLTNANGTSNVATVTIDVFSLPVAVDDGAAGTPAYQVGTGTSFTSTAPTGVMQSNDDYTLPNVYDDATVAQYADVGDIGGGSTILVGNNYTIPGSGGVTVNIAADGTITIDATAGTAISGEYSLDYEIGNSAGTDTATVVIRVTESPIAEDDLFQITLPANLSGDLTVDNGFGADTPGSPPFTTLTFGGGDLGGAVTDNTATSVGLAGGTLTITNTGVITLNGATNPGQYTFDYRLDNGISFDDATVTIDVFSLPVAVDDGALGTPAYTVNSGISFTSTTATGVMQSNDDYTLPNVYDDATVTQYADVGDIGGGSTILVGNNYTIPGSGGVTVNIAADGTITIDATAVGVIGGEYQFDYEIGNSAGSDSATVTILIPTPPDGFDDTDATVTGGTSVPGGNNFHLAINTPSNGIVNTYVDNGFGADILGNPSAPTDAPADTMDNVILAGTPDAGTGTIGGGAFAIGGSGSIEITTAGVVNITPPTNFVGLIEFDYTLANSVGTDATPATVTFAVGNRPVCTNDAYAATGHISINTLNVPGNSVLLNDSGDGITITAVQGSGANIGVDTATANTGTVNMTANGEFAYDPPAGFTGNDTFTYAIDNAFNTPATCTVTITVTDLIYFMDSAAAAGGDGSLSSPYQTIAEHNGAPPVANSFLYIEDNSAAYTGNLTLVNTQTVIGEGSSGTLFGGGSRTGIVLAPLSITVPYSLTNNPADWAQIANAGGNDLTANTNNTLSGIDIGAANGFGLIDNGGNVGNFSFSEGSVNNPTGGAINFANGGGTVNATFTTLTSGSSATSSINLVNITGGAITGNAGSLTGSTGPVVNITGGGVNLTYAGAVQKQGGATTGINITGHSGTVNLSNSVALGTTTALGGIGINLNANTGTYTFNDLDIVTNNAGGFIANNGGTVNVTGAGNTINSTNGVGLSFVAGTTIGGSNVTFQSISASNAINGIVLNGTGANSFTITGTGGAGTGGTIQDTSGGTMVDGISIINAQNISLSFMNLTNANEVDGGGAGVCDGNTNIGCNGAINLETVNNIALNTVNINGAEEQCINGRTVTNFDITGGTIQNCGNAINEHGIHIRELLGTAASGNTNTFTNIIVRASNTSNIEIVNDTATTTNNPANPDLLIVTGSTIEDLAAPNGSNGLILISRNAGNMRLEVSNTLFENLRSIALHLNGELGGDLQSDITTSTFQPGGGGQLTVGIETLLTQNSTHDLDIHDNTLIETDTGTPVNIRSFDSASFTGFVQNNNIQQSTLGTGNGNGIQATVDGSSATSIVQIEGNTIQQSGSGRGIRLDARAGSGQLHATLRDNIVNVVTVTTFPNDAIEAFAGNGTVGESSTLCVNYDNNAVSGDPRFSQAYALEQVAGNSFQIEGLAPPAGATEAQVEAFVDSTDQVPANVTVDVASAGGGLVVNYVDATCQTP